MIEKFKVKEIIDNGLQSIPQEFIVDSVGEAKALIRSLIAAEKEATGKGTIGRFELLMNNGIDWVLWVDEEGKNIMQIIEDEIREQKMSKYICPQCKNNRWKTVVKGFIYQCRKCGYFNGCKD